MYSILLKNISFSRQALRVPNISETPLRRFSCHPTSTCSTETFKRTENSLLSSQLEFVRNELKRWDPSQPITKSPTPPSTWYTDPSFFKAESNTVFRKNWLQVGRVEQLKESGDYVSGSIMGEPYVVLRDTNGELKAFYNVCRHHASRILQNGEGKLKEQQLVCPYHGWTYTLEGKLKRATQIKGIEDFKASNYGLKPMKVTTFGPWVFIKTDINDNSWDLNEELKPLSDMLEETNYKNLKWISQSSYTVNCNWKVYIDNYCDGGYHIPYLHKSLDTQIDMKSYDTKIFNKFSVQIAHGKESEDQYIKSRIGNTGAYYAYLYPNFMINRYGDTMDTNLVVPLSHDKTLVYFDYFYKTNVGPEYEDFVKKSVQISDEIQREDEFISEMVQQGLSSDGFDVGRYAPKIETAAYHFHQILYNDLK